MKFSLLGLLLLVADPRYDLSAGDLKTIDTFQAAAARANRVLSVPDWEQTPEALTASIVDTIAKGNAALDQIGSQTLEYVTFETTIAALEDLRSQADLVANRAALISETNPDPVMRAVAEGASKKFQEWNIGIDYREDIFKAIKAFAATKPKLSGEDKKLLDEMLRDYRRAGMELSPIARKQVERMRRELSDLAAEFDSNLFAATAPVVFKKADLDGVPDDFLSSPGIKIDSDLFQVMANLTWQYNTVEESARSEATRRKVYVAHDSLAKDKNVPVVNQMLALRNKIALRLGYKSWADYQAEVRMARTAANAQTYIDNLVTGIQPKFDDELRELQKMKAADSKDPNAKINVWDWRYYNNQLTKQKFAVDKETLRVFFPFQQTLDGMFVIFGRVFGLCFDEIKPPTKWANELRLYVVSDTATNAPLGLLYLDLFPREGKTAGGGESEIVNGRRLAEGKYQAPVAAVILNFPPPNGAKPSLLSHSETEVLFHELGHALHCIVTRAKYGRFAGTHVPVDFVEAPSQMLQNWIWDKATLDTFAADYRDRSKKIPVEIIQKMNAARLATAGMFYRRQFAFALLDLALHGPHPADTTYDYLAISNPILERVFLPIDPQTSFITGFRGFNGYDAGYYGYAWSDAIAADMATVFEKNGYLDKRAGMKLRREIYEPGDSRDVTTSIEKFLGRKQSSAPFLKRLGIGAAEKKKAPAGPSQEGK
ncbi:MAG: M3 family metallopeptidase [Verrucomicrobiota bacterium]